MSKRPANNSNCAATYKILRAFISAAVGKKLGEIDGDVASTIYLDKKSVEKILEGSRDFAWGEAKNTAKYFIDEYKGNPNVNSTIFRIMLIDFLNASANSDWQTGAELEFVDKFMRENYGSNDADEKSKNPESIFRVYSNMPNSRGTNKLIRKYIFDEINNGVNQQKILFLDGFTGTGKSYVAAYYAKYCITKQSDVYSAVIWNEDNGNANLTLNSIISNILSTFEHDNVGNMNTAEKIVATLRHMNAHRSILVVDNFESIAAEEKDAILRFLLERVSTDTVVIITCKNRMDTYAIIRQHMDRFHEVRFNNLTWEQWLSLSDELERSFTDVKAVLATHKDLNKFVFDLCEGNPYGMSHLITALSGKVVAGLNFETIKSDYLISDIDKSSHDWIVKKSISELADNDKKLLVALSLFAVPATPFEASKLSGLQGVDSDGSLIVNSPLYNSIMNCFQQILIERVITKTSTRFNLPPLLKPILRGELKEDNHNQYGYIVNNWIQYYKGIASEIGFCYDDFARLGQLDFDVSAKQSENIKVVLEYCFKHRLWTDFYEISENTKYFFYTRGISGIGNQSIHYKRSYAAQMLGSKVGEFNSLLYHCNVSCKAKEWGGIDDCFARIEVLKNSCSEINPVDLAKLTYIQALYYYAKSDFETARDKFDDYEATIVALRSQENNEADKKQIEHDYIACLRWHSACLYNLAINETTNADKYVVQALTLLDSAVALALPINFERAVVHSLLLRVQIMLNIRHDAVTANEVFQQLEQYKKVIDNDVAYNAEYTQIEEQLKQEEV